LKAGQEVSSWHYAPKYLQHVEASQMKTPPKHVLIVDDEPGVRQACRLMLSLDEHTVVEAKNGIEALDLFTKGRFDLVMTDFKMPGMNGNELAARIKGLAPSVPILMISAFVKEAGGSHSPVDATLSKPFSLLELRQAIAQLVP